MIRAMSTNTSSSNGGIGFAGFLALLFIGLKLTGYIDWSWWWVLAPIWGVFALIAVIFLVAISMIGLAEFLDQRSRRRR